MPIVGQNSSNCVKSVWRHLKFNFFIEFLKSLEMGSPPVWKLPFFVIVWFIHIFNKKIEVWGVFTHFWHNLSYFGQLWAKFNIFCVYIETHPLKKKKILGIFQIWGGGGGVCRIWKIPNLFFNDSFPKLTHKILAQYLSRGPSNWIFSVGQC